MSCCSHGKQSGECVCDVVRKIVLAQNEVAANQDDCCTTGCEQSINQLLSPTTGGNTNGPTTIPFLLYCKGDCDVFFARGIRKENSSFECVETPIFKAKRFKNGCCVELELLQFQTPGPNPPNPSSFKCGIIPPNATGELVETGICITVDLHCYCAIQCLDPVTPLPQPM